MIFSVEKMHLFSIWDVFVHMFCHHSHRPHNTKRFVYLLFLLSGIFLFPSSSRATQPDLTVFTFTSQKSALNKSTIPISFQIRNIGSVSSKNFYVDFYIHTSKQTKGLKSQKRYFIQRLDANQKSPLYTIDFVIPNQLKAGNYFLIAVVDIANTVLESDETNNALTHSIQLVTATSSPDLFLTFNSSPPRATATSSPTFVYTVRNVGTAKANSFYISFYYMFTTGSPPVFISRRAITQLDKNAQLATQKVNLRMPNLHGLFYIRACADSLHQLLESNETNNCDTRQIRLSTPAQAPDLQMTSFSIPKQSATGAKISITYKISNTGKGDAGRFQVNFYYGTSSSTTNLTLMGYTIVASLGKQSDTGQKQLELALPSHIATGTGYIHYRVDSGEQIDEQSEFNNFGSKSLQIKARADLRIATFSVPSSAFSQGKIPLTYSIHNAGAIDAGPFTVEFLFSDTFHSKTPQLLFKIQIPKLPAKGTTTQTTRFITLPKVTTAKTHFIHYRLDTTQAVSEGDETNNNGAKAIQMLVGNAPELSVAKWQTPASTQPGKKFNITIIPQNTGTKDASPSQLSFYYSSATTPQNRSFLTSQQLPAIKAKSSVTIRDDLLIPASVKPGKGLLHYCVDSSFQVAESDESNNCGQRTILLQPNLLDLVMYQWSAPVQANQGATLRIRFQVLSRHDHSPSFLVHFYYGTTSSTNGLRFLSGYRISGLQKGGISPSTFYSDITLPKQAKTGTGYLHFYIDAKQDAPESNEQNNRGFRPIRILPDKQKADLALRSLQLPSKAKANTRITLQYQLENKQSIPSTGFYMGFYLSPKKGANPFLLTRTFIAGIPAKSSTSVQKATALLPSHVQPGTAYVHYRIDDSKRVPESNEQNNEGIRNITIEPSIDLVMGNLFTTVALQAGGLLQISFIVRNTGSIDTGAFHVRFDYSHTQSRTQLTQLGRYAIKSVKKAAQTSLIVYKVKIPKSAVVGKRFIHWTIDDGKSILEANENNNTGFVGIEVLPPPCANGSKRTCYTESKGCKRQGTSFQCQGACKAGTQTCTNQKWGPCQGQLGPLPEKCDGKDNDCDGKTDETTSGQTLTQSCFATCGAGIRTCKNGQWAQQCIPFQTCSEHTGESTEGEPFQDGGTEFPDSEQPEEEPIESAGEQNPPEPNCNQLGCPKGEICLRGQCTIDPCQGLQCTRGRFCRNGSCVDACHCPCPSKERCIDGTCQKDLCAEVTCPKDERCESNTGKCIQDLCKGVQCPQQQVCQEGQCVFPDCKFIKCPSQYQCKDGQCIAPRCVEPPGDEELAKESVQEPIDSSDDGVIILEQKDAGESTENLKEEQGIESLTEQDAPEGETTGCCSVHNEEQRPALLFWIALFLLLVIRQPLLQKRPEK